METNFQHNGSGDTSLITALASVSISLLSNQPVLTFMSSCVAILASLFAIRYYYFATKKIKEK